MKELTQRRIVHALLMGVILGPIVVLAIAGLIWGAPILSYSWYKVALVLFFPYALLCHSLAEHGYRWLCGDSSRQSEQESNDE